MRTLKMLVMATLSVALVSSVAVAEDTNSTAPAVTLTSGIADRYIGFSSGEVFYNRAVVQSDVNVSFDSGFYVDIWNSKAVFNPWGQTFGDEVDYGIGWIWRLLGFNIDVGLTYFDEPGVMSFGKDDCWYTHVTVSHDVSLPMLPGSKDSPLTVSATYEDYRTTAVTAYKGGDRFSLGLSREQECNDHLSMNVSETFVYDSGAFDLDAGFLFRMETDLKWKLSEQLSLTFPQVNLYVPLTVSDNRETEVVVSTAASYKF